MRQKWLTIYVLIIIKKVAPVTPSLRPRLSPGPDESQRASQSSTNDIHSGAKDKTKGSGRTLGSGRSASSKQGSKGPKLVRSSTKVSERVSEIEAAVASKRGN
jgi:hypothetical protein